MISQKLPISANGYRYILKNIDDKPFVQDGFETLLFNARFLEGE